MNPDVTELTYIEFGTGWIGLKDSNGKSAWLSILYGRQLVWDQKPDLAGVPLSYVNGNILAIWDTGLDAWYYAGLYYASSGSEVKSFLMLSNSLSDQTPQPLTDIPVGFELPPVSTFDWLCYATNATR
jgi:hypothetical protein